MRIDVWGAGQGEGWKWTNRGPHHGGETSQYRHTACKQHNSGLNSPVASYFESFEIDFGFLSYHNWNWKNASLSRKQCDSLYLGCLCLRNGIMLIPSAVLCLQWTTIQPAIIRWGPSCHLSQPGFPEKPARSKPSPAVSATVSWPAEPSHLAQDWTSDSGGCEASVPQTGAQEQTLQSPQPAEMRA